MIYQNVVVAGGGVLGSQIAFQSAYCGANVTIWLRSEGSIGRTQPKLDALKKHILQRLRIWHPGRVTGVRALRMRRALIKRPALRR